MSNMQTKREARERAKAKIGFYIHLSVYVIVNIILFSIWFITMGVNGFPWFVFPLIGWGIGISAHGFATFYGRSFEDRMTERELSKIHDR